MRSWSTGGLSGIALISLVTAAGAQETAQLTGAVRAQNGTGLVDARVRFDPGAVEASAGVGGRFSLSVPAGISGELRVSAIGHAPEQQAIPALSAGSTRQLAVTLAPIYVLDAISVVTRRERPLLNTEDAATGGSLEIEELRALPSDARDPLSLAFTIAGVTQATGFFGDAPPLSINGASALYTQYFLDGLDNNEGFLGGPRVEFPLGGLSRLSVLANSYSSEFGRSSNGVVNAESRAGNNVWSGDTFGFFRPGQPFDADPKIVPPGTDPEGFRRFQLGGGAAGPIAADRTFIAVAAEYSNEREDRIGSTAQTQFIGTELREKVKVFGRVDHGWTPAQTTTLRFAYSSTSRAGQGTGVITPEADITTRRIGSLAALTHRSALRGGSASNTATVQLGTYRWYFPPTRSDFSRPQVTIVDPTGEVVQAVVGSSNFIFDETELQLQLRDVFEAVLSRRHTLRVGADIIGARFELTGAQTNPNGSYVVHDDGNIDPTGQFVSFEDIPADVRVESYTVDANPQQVDLTQTLIGAFVEDRFRISPSLLLITGLRWDYDDITSRGESSPDLNNFQPRVSFNWYRTPTSALRGGLGLYTGRFPYTIYSDAVQFGPAGNATVTFDGADAPPFLGGKTQAELNAEQDLLPPREIRRTFARGLDQPFSYQASLGYQVQLGRNWALSIDGVWTETRNLPRSIDLNPITPPLTEADSIDRGTTFGDASRGVEPTDGSFRRLTTTETGGEARYRGLYVAVRRRLSGAFSLDANWVWSRAETDTEDINFNAVQANCFSRDLRDAVTGAACTSSEWADATNDRRHRVALRGVYTMPRGIQLSLVADFQTGQPVNRIADFRDLDGSGAIFGNGFIGNHDRYFGVPRNGERLPAFFELSAGLGYRLPLGGHELLVRADVFNAFNGTEWAGFATGIPGGGSRTQTGRPGDPIVLKAPGRPRQVQFSISYGF